MNIKNKHQVNSMKIFIERLILKFFYRSKLNIWLGKKFFFNGGGAVSNLIGLYIKKRDKARMVKSGFITPVSSDARKIKKNGFLLVNNENNEKEISKLRNMWLNYVTRFDKPADGRFELSSADLAKQEDLDSFLPLLRDLFTTDKKNTLVSFFGSYFKIINYHI